MDEWRCMECVLLIGGEEYLNADRVDEQHHWWWWWCRPGLYWVACVACLKGDLSVCNAQRIMRRPCAVDRKMDGRSTWMRQTAHGAFLILRLLLRSNGTAARDYNLGHSTRGLRPFL